MVRTEVFSSSVKHWEKCEGLQLSDFFQWEPKMFAVLKEDGISGFPVFLRSAKETWFIQATGRHINIQ